MNAIVAATPDLVRGDATGIDLPTHPEALLRGGAALLTRAFQAFGSLKSDNRITRITNCRPCPGGSTGRKVFVSVEYQREEFGLDTELFVKFSRDFDDAIRDRQRQEMESEVRLAALSRHPAFPITVPTTYFADFQRESGTGVLITSVVDFGTGDIELHHAKCMDHELSNPLEYYRAILTALARIAAAHKSGRLSPAVEANFPFDREGAIKDDRIPFDAEQLRVQVARYRDLATRAPQLFPAQLAAPAFIARFEADTLRFLRHETAIKRYLHADPDYIALCHWNANIDNAWFWRDSARVLRCGLFDWGRVRQLNLAYPLWGSLCAAPREIWDEHLDALLALFIRELHAGGGPLLDRGELKLHLWLYIAIIGLAGMIVAPDRILLRLPEAVHASDPRDPLFGKSAQARNFLHIFTNMLNLWRTQSFGTQLDRMLERIDRPARGPVA
jgi:hypothetical protein